MTFTPVENVRGFFVSRPPLVVFMVCLASFAVALITFAYVVKVRDMPNPDINEDWNSFLEPLSDLDYCVVSEPGAAISNASQDAAAPEQGIKDRLAKMTNQILRKDGDQTEGGVTTFAPTTTTVATNVNQLMNVSLLVDLELMATTNLQRIAGRHDFTFISATLPGHQLGLTGNRQNLEANLTLVLPPLVNQSHQCQHGQCYKLINVCVTMTASRHFFPRTPLPDVAERCVREVEGGENHFHLEVAPSYIHCINASILTMRHQYDPHLTVMLTMQDRSVINLHLMHTSYFLFVMIVTLLCYALIKGRAAKVKVVYTQCTTDSNVMNHA
ncbi:hypothetical protein ACOMHN_021911 [Nucella lapillus]